MKNWHAYCLEKARGALKVKDLPLMTLKSKILVGYGLTVALMGVVVAWAVINLVSLGQATDAILRENYRSILAAENMVDALERQDSAVLLLFLGDPRTGVAQFRESEAVFLEWLARAKDNITIRGESDLLQSIEKDYAKYRREFSALTDFPGRDSQAVASPLRVYEESIHPLFAKVRQTCVQLRHLNEETMYTASIQAGRVAKRAIWSTVFVAALALFLALVFSLVLAERIVKPLRSFREASRKISSGDYAVQVPVETGDELGSLAEELNRMAAQLGHYHEMNIEQIITEKNKGDAILSSIEDGLVVFDTNLKVSGINPAARRMLDLASTDYSTLRCEDILPSTNVCEMIRKTFETGLPQSVPDEQRIVTVATGDRPRHYLVSVTAVRRRDQRQSGVVLLLRDITRLKEVDRLKSEFVMAVSHELRTPLTSMGMSIDLLLEHAAPGLSERDRELLRAAHEEVHRMINLVNDLLNLSKIEAGRIELEFEAVPVPTLFNYVQSVFLSQLEQKRIELDAQPAEALPEVRADANKVTWVLTNLISNALRYVHEGGHIQLSAIRIGDHVHISVRDDGPGIPLEYQTKIFQKFVQVEGQEGGGTGLGLAICKEIVRAHGGAIWVESTPGQGSTFTFTLPVAA